MRHYLLFLFLLLLQFNLNAQNCLNVTINEVKPSCNSVPDGSLTFTVNNGTPPYLYSIDNGATSQSSNVFDNLTQDFYPVLITDSQGCDYTHNYYFEANNSIFVEAPLYQPTLCSESETTTFGVMAQGGTPPYSYLWSTGSTTENGILVGTQTSYLTVTDATGCVNDDFSINAVLLLDYEITYDCSASSATVNAGSASGYPVLINWSNGSTQNTIDNLSPGTYYLTMEDYFCIVVDSINIVSSNMVLQTTVVEPSCTTEGQITSSLTGGTPPFSYLWNTGATTSDLNNVGGGSYSLTVTDANGCIAVENLSVSSVFDFDFSISPASCDDSDGSLTVSAANQNPLDYVWSNGATTTTVTGLAAGWYSVTATDNSVPCSSHSNVFLGQETDCFATISGYVLGQETGCTAGPTSSPLENRLLQLRDPNGTSVGYAFTDSDGYYEMLVPADDYTLQLMPAPAETLLCPAQYQIAIAAPTVDAVYSNDFHLQPILHDLSIALSKGPARPGFTQYYNLFYKNEGQETMYDLVITLVHEENLENFVAFDPVTSYDPQSFTATWELDSLPAGMFGNLVANLDVPVSTTLGTTLTSMVSINPNDLDDENLDNNNMTCHTTVTGSYDPNDKQNFSSRDSYGGDIDPSIMTYNYHIRFQNTGTDTAFTVVVKDPIDDTHLDLSTIRPLAASHAYTMDMEDNVLVFFFENIMLPDSNMNEPLSHGFVSFSIDKLPNLPLGTEIQNRADIYFDFNAPVLTNTVTNTLANPDLIIKVNDLDFDFKVTPNPLAGTAFIDLSLQERSTVSMRVLNVQGQQVLGKEFGTLSNGQHQLPLAYEKLAHGVYFVEVKCGEKVLTRKVVY